MAPPAPVSPLAPAPLGDYGDGRGVGPSARTNKRPTHSMPLLELRKCAHCGRNTWQEFNSLPPPARSYWQCRECGEQKEVPPVSCDVTQLLRRARIQTRDACADVHIVQITRKGAHLRLDPDFPIHLQVGDRLLFNAHLQPFGELAHYLPATVRWEKDHDCGITFARPLSLPLGGIMCIIKN